MKKRRVKIVLVIVVILCCMLYWRNTHSVVSNSNRKRALKVTSSQLHTNDHTIPTTIHTMTAVSVQPSSNQSLMDSTIHDTSNSHHTPILRECGIKFDFKDEGRILMLPDKNMNANCPKLFERGSQNYGKTLRRQLKKKWEPPITDTVFMQKLHKNCSLTVNDFSDSFYISKKERNFPIAFELLVHYKPGRVQQYIRLLKNIYRPHNVYCIHIDGKAPDWWADALIDFANCFPNILVTKKRIKVDYGTAKILYAHFECFTELLNCRNDWKYVISLHGTELPMVTNREMVDALVELNGTNAIQKGEDSTVESSQSHAWITYKVKSINDGKKTVLTNETLGPVPHNITIYKSAASANSAFSREFISFIFKDERSLSLAHFLKDVQSAVELFFSTVNSFPDAPGGYHSLPANTSNMPLIAKRDWVFFRQTFKKLCFSRKLVHNICIVGVLDLPRLGEESNKRSWWFHNKYFMEYDHVVMNCMENLLLRRNALEYQRDCL